MPYLGKSPSFGVRQRYQYTATASQTTFSGTDTANLTLNYTDNNFVDVYQNGVLLKGGGNDYTATSGTSVVLGTGATADDVIEIIVYDAFSAANFFSRTDSDSRYVNVDGDNMTGNLGIGTTSPDGALHVKGISDHGRIVLEAGGTSGSDNNTFIQFHNGSGTEIAQIAIEEGASNEGQIIFKTGGTTAAMTIDKDGQITKPLQPAFLAGPLTGASAQSGMAVGSDVTIILGNEIYDVNGDFASNTFTAPVTGKYQLSANITYNHFDEDSTQVQSGIKTSNRNYINQIDPDIFQEDADIITMTLTVVADMDANDTAFVFYNQTGGSSQTNVGKETTTFSGCLLA